MAVEIKVPDIGDFKDVAVIEIHVQPGQAIKAEDPLITLESDKATMDVPSPQGGTVTEVNVAVGDRVSQGSVVLVLEAEGEAGIPPKERIKEGAGASTGEAAGYGSSAGVYETLDVRVPDIGDFKDVPVIEVHVQPGATIKAEEPLITIESDKATMDVPAPTAGTVKEVKVTTGDRVSEGSLILTLETGEKKEAAPQMQAPPPAAAAPTAKPRATAPLPASTRRLTSGSPTSATSRTCR